MTGPRPRARTIAAGLADLLMVALTQWRRWFVR
jgi:hypothetical protein